MKKPFATLRQRPLTLLFVGAIVALFGTLALEELWSNDGTGLRSVLGVLLVGILLALSFIAGRILRFHARVRNALRRLVSGDYETGLRVTRFRGDEFTAIEILFNRLVEQLREYDKLRTSRIRQLRMTLDLVLEHAEEPMALFDVVKGTLEINAALSGAENGARQSVTLSALRDMEANEAFVALLLRAVEEEKSPLEERVTLTCPKQEIARDLEVRVVPFKDKDESVPLVVVFGKLV